MILSTPSMVVQCRRQKLVNYKPSLLLFYSHRLYLIFFSSKMDAKRQRVLVRKAIAVCKQKKQESGLAPNVAPKSTLKKKNNAKEDHSSKKRMGQPIWEQQPKASLPPPPFRHEAEKGLMTGKGLVAPSPIQRLVTHKDYAMEMVTSIIMEIELDLCGENSL